MKALDLTGLTFNYLTGIRRVTPKGAGRVKWEFKCTCGSTVTVVAAKVKNGLTKSCGCNGLKPSVHGPFLSLEQAKKQGSQFYFTGLECSEGHIDARYTAKRSCATCVKNSAKEQHNAKKHNPEYRQKAVERVAFWRKKNPEKALGLTRKNTQKAEEDPKRRAAIRIRCLLKNVLINHGGQKAAKTEQLLGCSMAEARNHLEAQFLPGMSWANHGQWHIDHIRPCASFDDLTKVDQQKECCHYTNLQPLWAADNISKSDKWEPVLQAA